MAMMRAMSQMLLAQVCAARMAYVWLNHASCGYYSAGSSWRGQYRRAWLPGPDAAHTSCSRLNRSQALPVLWPLVHAAPSSQ